MTKEDWTLLIALLGALAWTIPLFNLLKKVVFKPKLIPHIDEQIEIGYDENGPFITMAIAFTARNQSVFITNAAVTMIHEDNETHTLQWDTYGEVILSFEDGYDDYFGEELSNRQRAIALNIAMNDSVDKEIDFVNKTFMKELRNYDESLRVVEEKYSRFKNKQQKIIESDAYRDYLLYYKNKFCWKVGKYSLKITFTSSDGKEFDFQNSFSLTDGDVHDLKTNISLFKQQTDIDLFSDDYTQFVSEYESALVYLDD
ncbi:MAG: hypothetical protein AAFQ94_29975 [Bacteroidota bacterium]